MSISGFIAKQLTTSKWVTNYALNLRKKRAKIFKEIIIQVYNKNKEVNILDIGGNKEYWQVLPQSFLKEKNVTITILNLSSQNLNAKNDTIFSFIIGDGCNMVDIKDNAFHLAHSNSVIEHVGNYSNMQLFSNEIRRVAENYYLQTPNYWFPIEPHFRTLYFQLLPKSLRISLIRKFSLGRYRGGYNYETAKNIIEHCNLLTKKKLLKLFPDCKLYREKVALMTKSFYLTNK